MQKGTKDLFRLKRRRADKIALACAVACCLQIQADANAESLAGRTNEELLAIIRGGATNRPPPPEFKSLVLPPDFWTTHARDAALALVLVNCSEETKHRVAFSISEPLKGQPPETGEVGIRWNAGGTMAGGLRILRAAGERSHLAYSAVELAGEATKKEIRAAIDRTTKVSFPPDVARQVFQVIWWLGRIRQSGEPEGRSLFMTHQTMGTFWIKPGLSPHRDVTMLDWALDGEKGEKFDLERHAGFAWFLISEAAKQQPRDITDPTATLGEGVYPDEGFKFLRTKPKPRSVDETEFWLDRTLKILADPRYRIWRTVAINNLVPWNEPMRYSDPRIDTALRRIANEPPGNQKNGTDNAEAMEALAWRDCTEILPHLYDTLRRTSDDRYAADELLSPASLLASRHKELRSRMIDYLDAQIADIAHSKNSSWKLFDIAWRFDFRELQTRLESLATANAPEVEHEVETEDADIPSTAGPRRFHAARKILLIWSESDRLTKLKLDALWEACSTALFRPAEHLQRQFDQLSDPEKSAFREFVSWMKQQELPDNWSPERAEWAISPEALAAAE